MIIRDEVCTAEDWCFIVGWGRTGTTVLSEIISTHKNAKVFSEAWLWGYIDLLTIPTLELSTPQSSMYREMEYYKAEMPPHIGAKIDNYVLMDNQPYIYDGKTEMKENNWSASQIRKILEGYRSALTTDNNIIFGDKHWYYRSILDDLLKVFPGCKLIVTTRNKWDLAASSLDHPSFSDRRKKLSQKGLAKVALERAEKQCKEDKNLLTNISTYELKFEDMADNPEIVIKNLFEYLNLEISSDFNWNVLNRMHYKEAMHHWKKIPELVELKNNQ